MTLCEHWRLLAAAAEFAQAAAHEIVHLGERMGEEAAEKLAAREDRIWASLFTYALDSRRYEVRTWKTSQG